MLVQLENAADLTVVTQDCDTFPEEISDRHFDEDLAMSWHHEIETVPTLISVSGGKETDRTVGWSRSNWEKLSGVSGLGINLPEQRPGCGSLSVDPSQSEVLAVRFGDSSFASRRIEFAALEDSHEALFDRGWTDGLPVVPPTEDRVLKMLAGTSRSHDEVVAVVPPDLAPCTVEKIAINAVMAGCRPEYLPKVISAVEAVCTQK